MATVSIPIAGWLMARFNIPWKRSGMLRRWRVQSSTLERPISSHSASDTFAKQLYSRKVLTPVVFVPGFVTRSRMLLNG